MDAPSTFKRVEVTKDVKDIRKQALGMLGSAPDQSAYNYGMSPDLSRSDVSGLRARSNIMRMNDAQANQRAGSRLAGQTEDWQMKVNAINDNYSRRGAIMNFLDREKAKQQAAGFLGTAFSTFGNVLQGTPAGAIFSTAGAGANAYGQSLDPERRLREGGY